MKNSLVSVAVGAALTATASVTVAAPFNSFDPRSMGMGGAGVAVANAATAPFFNPALLSVTEKDDDFALELPIIGGRLTGVELINDLDDIVTYSDELDQAIQLANANLNNTQAYHDVATATRNLSDSFEAASGKVFQGQGGAATVLAIPSKDYGMALTVNAWGAAGAVGDYTDAAVLNTLANDVDAYATNCTPTYTAGCANSLTLVQNNGLINFSTGANLTSTATIRGLLVAEAGISLSREFYFGSTPLAVGITPKLQQVATFEYLVQATNWDSNNFNDSANVKNYSNFNLDLGLAKDYANGWRTGLVVKNMMTQEYETVLGNKVKLNPQARFGVSHENEWSTVALDVDLTENEPAGLEQKSQYVSLGAELNGWDVAQVRVGYRADMVDSNRNVASAGLGFSPFGLHVDIGVAMGADELGGAMQLGFRF